MSAESSGLPEWVPILSALTALVAVFLGPVLQWYANKRQILIIKRQMFAQMLIAKRQLMANLRSSNRMIWINALREDLVEYLSVSADVGNLLLERRDLAAPVFTKDVLDLCTKAAKIRTRIILRVNPEEDEHTTLLELLKEMEIKPDRLDSARLYNEARERLLEHAQKILKSEWERVKNGE